ncbi:hypothetical protein GX586_14240, partial [bacterium]|nr:hypothetical protein [bacterium]
MNARTIRFIIPVTAALAALACLAADTPPPWLNTTRGWYDFKPANDSGPSVIGMQDWLEKPAGTRGGVRMVGDHFEFADGTRVKFWGVNLGNMDCAPDKPAADTWADRYAKYGVNCVRLHKFINSGSEGIGGERDSTKYDPRKLDQLDYFSAKLKSNGMYFGWSHSYHFKVRPGDRARLVAYDEIETKLKGDTLGLINAAEDVQDVMIAAVLALLAHTNAYTGIPYAKEPALAFIEFQNEDDILFYSTTQNALDACPTYKRLFVRKWNAWLTNKYRTEQALEKAWGKEAFDVYGVKNESLEKQNIALQLNGWFMGNAGLTQAVDRGTFVRLVDNAAFLHEQQNAYYSKFLKALRDAGYEGPTVGSCWQAPAGIASYYNLLSDYLVGFIDRHNYFGGMGGYRPVTGTFRNEAHVTHPGSGLLSSGLQQVVDRPFALSEWASVFPNEWYAESPVMIAAYGLGLQGWDASYQFASSTGRRGLGYQKALHLGTGMWLTEIPTQIGMYPLIA